MTLTVLFVSNDELKADVAECITLHIIYKVLTAMPTTDINSGDSRFTFIIFPITLFDVKEVVLFFLIIMIVLVIRVLVVIHILFKRIHVVVQGRRITAG